MDNLMSGLLGAVIGSIVGGLLSSWLGWLVYKKQTKSNLKLQKCDEILNSYFKINTLLDDLCDEIGCLENWDLLKKTNNVLLVNKINEVLTHAATVSEAISIYGNILHISEIEADKPRFYAQILQVLVTNSDISNEDNVSEIYRYIDLIQNHLTSFSKTLKLNSHKQLYTFSDSFFMLRKFIQAKFRAKYSK